MNCHNLVGLLERNRHERPKQGFLYHKVKNRFHGQSYQTVFNKIDSFSRGLASLGVKAQDRVAIVSSNRPEWAISDLSILSLGAIVVPIYPTLSASEIEYIINDSRAKIAIVESPEQLKYMHHIQQKHPYLKTIILIESSGEECLSFEEVQNCDQTLARLNLRPLAERATRNAWDELASIVYTSGTTGNPKGVQLTHGNFLSNVQDVIKITPLSSKDVVLSFLPLSHVFERTVGYYTLIAVGGKIYYAESIDKVGDNIRECHPTILVSVPRLYEKIQAKIFDGLHGLKKPIFNWGLKVGRQYHQKRKSNKSHRLLKIKHKLARLLVYKKIQARTGGRLRFFVSGGAPLGRELGAFFENLGLLILEGYGLTETGPIISCNRLDSYKMGTVGQVLPSQTVKLTKDGELLVKGPNVMKGYWNLEEETKKVIDKDGWFHTGDIAEIDEEGFIKIIDRKKEIMVLSNGKNIPPQVIERAIVTNKYIAQIVVIGEGRKYLTALIVPQIHYLKRYIKRITKKSYSDEDIIKLESVKKLYKQVIERRLKEFAPFEHIKYFTLLPNEFSPETGELTPTLKPRRKIISKKYKELIDLMY